MDGRATTGVRRLRIVADEEMSPPLCPLKAAARIAGAVRYVDRLGIERFTVSGNKVPTRSEAAALRRRARKLQPIEEPPTRKQPKKQYLALNHEQKRQVAKHLVSGRMVKQVAAEFRVSLDACYRIATEYTVLTRTEKYPDGDE